MRKLLDPKIGNEFPFQWRDSSTTDIRATFDRIKPGWNRKPEPKPQATNVERIRQRRS